MKEIFSLSAKFNLSHPHKIFVHKRGVALFLKAISKVFKSNLGNVSGHPMFAFHDAQEQNGARL